MPRKKGTGTTSRSLGASIMAIIEALDVTDIGAGHGKSPKIRAKIFVDDEELPREKIQLVRDGSTYTIPEPVKLAINPSSILKVIVDRDSSLAVWRVAGRVIGEVSKRISELNMEPYCSFLKDRSAGSIEIRLKIDGSAPPTVDELGLEHASQVLENAHRRVEKQTGGHTMLNAASGIVDQAVGYADDIREGYSDAEKASDSLGVLREALVHLDKFVHLVDGFANVHPLFQSAWMVLSFVYKAVKQQLEQDAAIQNLALQLRNILAYARECQDLKAVKGGTNTIRRMGQLVVQGGSLIDECMRRGFLLRAAKSAISGDLQNRIQQCERDLTSVKEDFMITLAIHNHKDTKREKVLGWLFRGSFDERHADVRELRSANTGSWIVDILEQHKWTTEKGLLVLGIGDPGVGKTFLCSVVVDHMRTLAAQQNYGVGYFYFSVDRTNEQNIHHVLCSLTKQLAAQQHRLPKDIESLYDKLQDGTPSSDQLKTAIFSIVKANLFSHMFLMFDALDECTEGLRSALFSLFQEMTKQGINVFVTSRPNVQQINPTPPNARTIVLSAKEHDVQSYLEERIDGCPCLSEILCGHPRICKADVMTAVVEAANGMFLLARFYADCLCDVNQGSDLEDFLRDLKQSAQSGDFRPVYDTIIERIRQQSRPARKLAFRIFCWLVMAWRVLRVEELQVAVSVKGNQISLDPHNLPSQGRLIAVCAGLVVIDKAVNAVRLSHATVREYLLETLPEYLIEIFPEYGPDPDPNWMVVEACAAYLTYDVFKAGACPTMYALDHRLSSHPLVFYAARHIRDHARIRDQRLSTGAILKILEHQGYLSSYLQVVYCEGHTHSFDVYPRQHSALHAACRIGHDVAVRRLIDGGASVTNRDTYGNHPIHDAGESRNDAIVLMLIEEGAEVDVQNSRGYTPLHRAAQGGWDVIVKLLVDHGAELNVCDSHGNTALHWAAQEGWEAIARLLVEKGAKLNVQDNFGYMPLHWATYEDQDAIAKLLIENGAEVNVQDSLGYTPLHQAARKGWDTIAKLLVENGAELNVQASPGYTPLHQATWKGWDTIAKLLIEKGAEINLRDRYGCTPLHQVAEIGRDGIAKLLVGKGAEVDVQDSDGCTPLHRAAWRGCDAIVKLLVENGAEVNVQDRGGNTPLHRAAEMGRGAIANLLLKRGAEVNVQASNGYTPLHQAAWKGQDTIAKLLIEKGADVNVQNDDGNTPLHRAAEMGRDATVKLLIHKGADVNMQDCNGYTPLHRAAKVGRDAIAKLLVENGTHVNVQDSNGYTPLHWMAETGWEAVAKILIVKGAEVNVQDSDGYTPLHWAAWKGRDAIAKLLIENGAEVNVQASPGYTPLHKAAWKGWDTIAEILVVKGAEVNTRDRSGHTPLHLAAEMGCGAIVKFLVVKGAEVNVQDNYGKTPLHLAADKGWDAIAKLLVEKGADVNVQDSNGCTPLHRAACKGLDAIAKLLVEKGAEVNVQDSLGITPLHSAVLRRHKNSSASHL